MEIETSDLNFKKDVIEKSKTIPVIVDFWASWCPPCQILKPLLERIAKSPEYKDKILLAKLNVEENQKIASEYSIMSIPAVKMFKKGKIVSEFIGAKPESDIIDWINKNI